jgi:valyl-tRNA synthetase
MFAPFVPYITEEIWNWEFSKEEPSVHRAPWPALSEIAAVPAPASSKSWQAALMLTEQVRKAKADANLSMAAPVREVLVKAAPDWMEGVRAAAQDIIRMLRVETWNLVEDETVDSVLSSAHLE